MDWQNTRIELPEELGTQLWDADTWKSPAGGNMHEENEALFLNPTFDLIVSVLEATEQQVSGSGKLIKAAG